MATFPLLARFVREAHRGKRPAEGEEWIAIDALPENLAVWRWDAASREFLAADRFRQMFGLQLRCALTTDTVLQRIHPEDRASFERLFADGGNDDVVDFAFRLPLSTDDPRWIVGRAHAWRDASGKPVRANGVIIDVTERKHAEIEAKRHHQQLTHLARVALLGELSNALAHEMNQPLFAILSNAQAAQKILAQDPVDLDEVRAIVADIATVDRRAAEVIRRFRDMLRRGNAQVQQLDLAQAALDAVALARSALTVQHVVVHVHFEHTLPPVSGDRVQLQQVLLNLLLNAADAMSEIPAKDRRIDLVAAKDAALVHVKVVDRGAGIPVDQLDCVFEPFYTTKGHGLGLGLTISRSIVTAHGGRLWATNNDGAGACFHLALPALTHAQLHQS